MKALSLILALLLALCLPADARTRDEIRAAYQALQGRPAESPYAALPVVSAPYEAGALTDAARSEALNFLNFTRWLAGLEPVSESVI